MHPFLTLLKNLKFLMSQNLRRQEWRLWMMEKSIQGVGAAVMRAPLEQVARSEINEHEYSIYSQFGQNGILAWIFSKIQPKSKTFIEIGCGSGRQCNSAYFILDFGWKGLLVDGSEVNIREAREFFKYLMPWRQFEKLQIEQHFVTRENINDIIAKRDEKLSPDLLCIDVDGNDYWVWEQISAINPSVVVVEYNATYGSEEPLVTPYNAEFDAYKEHPLGLYHGASILALQKLGKKKGYILLGCDSNGADAFFVKKEFAHLFTEVSAKEAFYENQHKAKRGTVEEQFALIRDKAFVRM